MKLRAVESERFQDYKLPSLFLAACSCDFKCCKEQKLNRNICQNELLFKLPIQEIPDDELLGRFREDPIQKAVVIGGMEPFLQFEELLSLIRTFRAAGEGAPFVIYTGYYPEEIADQLDALKAYPNIIVKFGRYIPGQQPHYDSVLGISLASDNQFARKIS